MKAQGSASRGTRHLVLCDHPVCNKGFMKLLAVGKHRFSGFAKALKQGMERCPMDSRFMPREGTPQSVKRQAVHDFLYALYEQAGERLPDGNSLSSNKRPRQGKYKYDDAGMSRGELRHLPPGKFMDYLRLRRLENPDYNISRQLFSSVMASNHLIYSCFELIEIFDVVTITSTDSRCRQPTLRFGCRIFKTDSGSDSKATMPSAPLA